eukprot:1847731-Pleurochrysis_carterae.AAC.5
MKIESAGGAGGLARRCICQCLCEGSTCALRRFFLSHFLSSPPFTPSFCLDLFLPLSTLYIFSLFLYDRFSFLPLPLSSSPLTPVSFEPVL